MDIYDFHDKNDEKLGEDNFIDWEEIIAFGIAIIILTLATVGLIAIIRMLT